MRLAGAGVVLLLAVALGAVFAGLALAAPPEAPETKPATVVAGTSATLNGVLNPNVSAAAGFQFTYNTNETCVEGPTTGPGAEATGKAIKVSAPLTGLEAATQYTFCVVATHTEGEVTETASGLPLSFTTLASKPVLMSESASAITPFAATLEGQVNPENQATTSCTIEYGLDTKYETGSAACEPASVEGSAEQRVAANITGLSGATTYHFRVVVANATGETEGPDGEFTTLTAEKPLVDGESVSALTATGAKLEAQVNPNYQETTYSFEYATNEALTGATTVAGAEPIAAGFGDQPATAEIAGLQARTTYFYRVVATNPTGTEAGPIQSFTTLATPIVATGAANAVRRTSALLTGTVNPAGAATTYHFAYIDQVAYEAALAQSAPNPYAKGATTLPSAGAGSDYATHAAGPSLASELKPGVTYHYALLATNSVGTTIGVDATFTTAPPTPPFALTGEALGVTQLAATLTGTVDTQGLQTALKFEISTDPVLGHGSFEAATITPGSESGSTVGIETSFGNHLQPGTTYYYRALATNADGASYGAERSFATGSFPGLPAATPVQLIAWPPFVAIALVAAEPHPAKSTGGPKPLTTAQKRAKALKACGKKPKRQRPGCRRQAKRRYR